MEYFYDHALGFPRVDLGSNGGQIGVKQVCLGVFHNAQGSK